MSAFQRLRRDAGRKPPRVLTFPPTIFKDDWRNRPTDDVAIGLRVPGDHDMSLARANAARLAWELHPAEADVDNRVDAMNDALIREVCAAGMCNANNVYEPYFPTPEDDVRTKLTPEGAKSIFDEIERLQLETSPVHREATDEEIASLSEALTIPAAVGAMPSFRERRVRRLIAFLLDEFVTEI